MEEKKGVQCLKQEDTQQWHGIFEASGLVKSRISKETVNLQLDSFSIPFPSSQTSPSIAAFGLYKPCQHTTCTGP